MASMTIPKSGFIATIVAIAGMTAITIVGMYIAPDVIGPHINLICGIIGGLGGYYAKGRLERDVREHHNGKDASSNE